MTDLAVVPTCPGRCCAVFYFPLTPAELVEKMAETRRAAGVTPPFRDAEYIADMLEPLTIPEATERWTALYGEATLPPGLADPPEASVGHLYTCRHWDEETRLCGAYESRPDMCRDYPYAGACFHGCGYSAPPETTARYVTKAFDWKVWRWSSAAGGYRSPAAVKADWKPGHGWSWDGTTLRPTAEGWDWDHRRRRWVASA